MNLPSKDKFKYIPSKDIFKYRNISSMILLFDLTLSNMIKIQ